MATFNDTPIPQTKRCACKNHKGNSELPATLEFFAPNKRMKLGLQSYCRKCQARHAKEKYLRDPDVREKQRIASNRRYHENPKERERQREYQRKRRENPEIKERIRLYQREYRAAHKSDVQTYQRAFRQSERGRLYRNEYQRKRYHQSPSVRGYYRKKEQERLSTTEGMLNHRLKAHKRREKVRTSGTSYTSEDVQQQIKAQTDKNGKLRCWWCGKVINKDETYHIDHWIPLDKNGLNDASNIRIMHARCNLSKHAKLPSDFGRLL